MSQTARLARADEVSTIDFARYFHDLSTEGPLYVSWGGGAIIELKGEGFNDSPPANAFTLTTTSLGGSVTVPGTPMTGKLSSLNCGILLKTTHFNFNFTLAAIY